MHAVSTLVADASRGMARSMDVNRIALLRLAATRRALTPGDAAARLDLPASSITRHTQALEAAGHIRVRRNERDARSAVIEPTEAGITELAAIDAVGTEIFTGVVSNWTPEEIHQLAVLLERLTTDWATRGNIQKRQRRRVSRWQRDDP